MNRLKKIERVGIFGGSFNPIHNGHIQMAELAIKNLKLDKLYMIPLGIPSHRSVKGFASGEDRLKMIELAFEGEDKIIPSNIEIREKKISYTYDTLIKINKKYPDAKIYEIIGEDSVIDLKNWNNYKNMINLCEFVFFKRKGYSLHSDTIRSIEAPFFNLSSTLIREKIKKKESLKKYLNIKVEEYIRIKKLYI